MPAVPGFHVGAKLGNGTFGDVYRVVREGAGEPFALKLYRKTDDDGIDPTTLREVSFLTAVPHLNVLQLVELLPDVTGVLLPLAEADVSHFARVRRKTGNPLSALALRTIAVHIRRGLAALHGSRWMHRDVKLQNCLLSSDRRVVQIADFGLVRRLVPGRAYTLEAVTLWYRAPELLLGCERYDSSVDMWAYGCVLPELVTGSAWCAGDAAIGQLFRIFDTLGAPDEAQWPAYTEMPHYQSCFPKPRERKPPWTDDRHPGLADLRAAAEACLVYDPLRRPTASALESTAEFAALPERSPVAIEQL